MGWFSGLLAVIIVGCLIGDDTCETIGCGIVLLIVILGILAEIFD